MMICIRCDGTGFLNADFIPDGLLDNGTDAVLQWIVASGEEDVTVCDCCGNGEDWYGLPGYHYATSNDQPGKNGPYAYNGGLCECN